MVSEISLEQIREEIRNLALQEKVRLANLQRQKLSDQRMKECERLNALIKQDNEEFSGSVFDRPDPAVR